MITTNDIFTTSVNPSFTQKDFEKLYIATRKKENRLYTDGQVAQLPEIETSHVHYAEWEIRKVSAERLINYLGRKKKALTILEVGCGNGWLSSKLAMLTHSTVTGADVNKTELEQAKRVFDKKLNLSFIEGNTNLSFSNKKFDVIVFAASIQYFSCFENIIQEALSLLNEGGEIHLLDSYFYKVVEIANARERSLSYYHSIGYPEMAGYYFHHTAESLNNFNHKLLYNPAALKNKIFSKSDSFPWICIKSA